MLNLPELVIGSGILDDTLRLYSPSKDHKQVCTSITKQAAVSVVCMAKNKSDNEAMMIMIRIRMTRRKKS